jgi:hypothetical protein
MKYLKYFEANINWEDEVWDDEEDDKTRYRIITIKYSSSRYRFLQFLRSRKIKKGFFKKREKIVDEWCFIPDGKHIDIYKKDAVYPVVDNRNDPDFLIDHNLFNWIYIELKSENSDNELIEWAEKHPYIEEYLKELKNKYKKFLDDKKREKERLDNLNNNTAYL